MWGFDFEDIIVYIPVETVLCYVTLHQNFDSWLCDKVD